jgi:hypothetical protein
MAATHYKVYVKDPRWELLAAFALLEHAVEYAISLNDNDGRTYKVSRNHRTIKKFGRA